MGSSSSKETVFKMLLAVAMAVLLHAAYSVAEWRSLTRQNEPSEEDETQDQGLPLDITIQTVVGFLLAMLSVVNIAGDFKEIRASIEMANRSWEHVRNRPSFYTYNHRGKAFSPEYVPPTTSPSNKKSSLDIPQKFLQ